MNGPIASIRCIIHVSVRTTAALRAARRRTRLHRRRQLVTSVNSPRVVVVENRESTSERTESRVFQLCLLLGAIRIDSVDVLSNLSGM